MANIEKGLGLDAVEGLGNNLIGDIIANQNSKF
jgi:hypothetical protein